MISAPNVFRTYCEHSMLEYSQYIKTAHLESCGDIYERTSEAENQ